MMGLTFHSKSSKTANYLNLHLLKHGFINCIVSDLKVQKENISRYLSVLKFCISASHSTAHK